MGAPQKNKNAFKHGLFTKEAIEEQYVQVIGQARKLLQDVDDRGPLHRGEVPPVRLRPPFASWSASAQTSSEAEEADRPAHGNERADAAPSPC